MALTLRTGGGLLSPASAVKSNTNNDGKNNGGLIGGVGYLAEKSALGFLSSVEGIWDYSAGGVAKLFGVDQWAERQFANDWVNYTHADEWYDPGRGWQIAGDVSGGIGTSMPAIAGVAVGAGVAALSGGSLTPVSAGIISASVAGLGAAGTATKEAYQKTGELGLKEFGYGALSGATEAALEGVTAGLGTGTGRIVSSLSKKAAGETVQTLSKVGAKSVIKNLAADFATEAVEEGLAEAIDPLWQKLTVDPNAKAASAQEIGYAALVGGLSGLVMSGGAATVNTVANLSSGNAAINSGNAEKIIKTASNISAYEDANDTGYESYKAISADYKALSESLSKTGGQISTAKQRMLLGSLKRAETAAFVEPFIERSATNLLLHADSNAERFNLFGMTDADGNQITVTADDIRSGVDADLIRKAQSGKLTEAEQKTFTKQVRAAMRSNSVLTTLATMDATGRITMDTRKFAEAAREGAEIATAADINAFAETASQEEIRSLAADLGIDDWAALTPDTFREKTAAFAQSDRGRELSYQNKRIRAAMGIAEDSAVALPKAFSGDIAEGATRYRTADGIDMAIIREGDRNYIYNYESGDISHAMSEAEVNKILADYWSGSRKAATDARMALSRSEAENTASIGADISANNAKTSQNDAKTLQKNVATSNKNLELLGTAATARYNMLAAENIKGWRQLSEPVKQAVRMTMRQAEAAGLSEDTAITFGRVAAHSGMNIVFNSIRSGAGDALQTGNTIYIDPGADKSRIEKRLLIHEMAHALIKRQGGMKLLTEAYFATDPAQAKEIEDRYIAYYEKQGMSEAEYIPIVSEEIAVSHLEDLLGREGIWDYMLADEPSLGEKVLSFFRGTARDYADDAGLSAESRKLLTMYRKMFRELSERNRGNNLVDMAREDAGNKKAVTRMDEENMRVTGERFALPEKHYSYETLTGKKDISVVKLPDEVPTDDQGKIDKAAVIATGRTFARAQKNAKNTETETYVFVPDIQEDVMIRSRGLSHGLGRNAQDTASATMVIGELLKNSIAVNELNGRTTDKRKTDMSYVLLAVGQNKKSPYLVRIVVDKTTGTLSEVSTYGLYAVNAKKNGALFMPKGNEAVGEYRSYPYLRSTISIADLLENVKGLALANEIFSNDVLAKLGVERTRGTLSENVRYALPEEGEKKKKYHMSDAQLRADVANKIHKKAYSKADARETLRGLTGVDLLQAKVQNELATYLWQGFNTCETQEQREKFSKGFGEELGKMLYLMKEPDPNAEMYRERLEHFRAGIGRLTISSGQYAGDFMHLLDKDGYRSFRARWGFNQKAAKKGYKPYSVDEFVNDIAGELEGMAHLREMNPADAMIEIDRMYAEAKAGEKATYSIYTEEEANAVMRGFERQVMQAFDERGKQSVFAKRVGYLFESYAENAERMQAEFDEINGRNKILGMISAKAQKMKELKMGTYANATQMDSEVFKGSIETLAGIDYRGNLSVTKAKKALRELEKWYRTDNGMLQYVDEENRGFFDRGIAEMLHELTETDEPFTKDQLSTLLDVMSYFTNFVEKYGKIWRGGKWIDAKPIAERYVQTLLDNEKIELSLIDRLMRTKYLKNFGDPASVVRQMDRYQRGFYTEIYEELRAAAEKADVLHMNVMTDYDAFMKKNPKYIRDVVKQQVVWTEAGRTNAMPKMTAISLYMTSKREQAQAGLALNGFKFKDADGKVTRTAGAIIRNPDDPRKVTQAEISQAMTELQNRLKKQFSAEDLAYIKILEKAYGYDLRSLKAERDMQKMGFTNATLDYYYPIRRADIAKSIDVSAFAELDRVSNASFNKNTVQGARGKLFIEDADALFQRHATAVTRYAALSPAIENFNILFNMDISGNPNDSVSVATVGESQWEDAKNYFRDLIGDIQGVPKNTGEFSKELSALRSHVAMSQLGANPKTWVTQFSSLFAASSRLDPASIMQGMRYGTKDVDIYCDLAKLRNYDAAAIKAQGVLDRVSHAGEVLMKPIAATDRLVVRSLWGACQVQVQKNQNLKLGTDENKVAAGKLLTEVLLETQQNSLATEKSSMMRSGNEILRALTMFSADGMKVTGRYLDGLGEVSALKQRIKAMGGTADDATKEALKQATKRMQKALAAMVSSAVFSVLIAEGFRLLYAKEREEDESAFADMLLDFTGNMLGGLPGLRDVHTFMVDGYELDNYAISAVNDLLSSVKSSFGLAFDLARGEGDPAEIPAKVKSLSYATGQFTGIPVRNIYNLLTGLTRRFSPVAGYQIDRVFYSKNYRNDLREAVEAGDTRMVAMLTGIIHGKDASGEIGDEGMEELNRLTMAGASVLPRTVAKQITVDGEEIELTKEQRTAITTAYEDGWSVGISELMNSPTYANMTDEQREDAIRKLYDIAYEQALLESGFDRGERSVTLASAVGISKAAVYYATVSGMEADVDRKGNKIEGSRRAKTVAAIEAMTDVREERLLLLTAAGYSLKAGDFRYATAEDAKRRLLKYIINMKGVSAEEKAAIAVMCGFEVKNGKVSAKSLST